MPVTIRVVDNRPIIKPGGNIAVVLALSAAAQVSADSAALSATAAESLVGLTYADTTAGLAGTVDGEGFAVDNGDGTVTIYENDAGVAVELRRLATSAALAASDGAERVGYERLGATGSVLITSREKMRDVLSYRDFDIDPTGANDSTGGLTAAVREASQHGQSLILPGGTIVTNGIDLDPGNDASYPRYGQIDIRGSMASSFPTNDKGGGTRIVHADGQARPLIRAHGISTSDSVRQLSISGLLLKGGNLTTRLVEVIKGTEMVRMQDNFLRILNAAGDGYSFDECYGLTIDGGRVFGTANTNGTGATGTGLIIRSGGLSANMTIVNNLDLYRCGTGKRIGGINLSTDASICGPVLIMGGQSSNCDQVGTLIGAGARNTTILAHHTEGCYKAGIAITNQARMTALTNCSYNDNGKDTVSGDCEIGFNGYNTSDARGAIGVTIRDASHYNALRPYRIYAGNNLHSIRFEGTLDATPAVGAGSFIDVSNTAISSPTETSFVSVDDTARLLRVNGANSFSAEITDPQKITKYRQETPRRISFTGTATTVAVGAATSARFNQSAPTTVTDIGDGLFIGQVIELEFANTNTTIQNNAKMNLAGAVDYAGTANSSILVKWDGTKWVERRR